MSYLIDVTEWWISDITLNKMSSSASSLLKILLRKLLICHQQISLIYQLFCNINIIYFIFVTIMILFSTFQFKIYSVFQAFIWKLHKRQRATLNYTLCISAKILSLTLQKCMSKLYKNFSIMTQYLVVSYSRTFQLCSKSIAKPIKIFQVFLLLAWPINTGEIQ